MILPSCSRQVLVGLFQTKAAQAVLAALPEVASSSGSSSSISSTVAVVVGVVVGVVVLV